MALQSIVSSKWKYRTLQFLLIVPALYFLSTSIYHYLFTCPVVVPVVKNVRVVELETSLESLSREVDRLQLSMGPTQSGLVEIYKENLSIRGLADKKEILCKASDPTLPDFCIDDKYQGEILKNYQAFLEEKKQQQPPIQVASVFSPPSSASTGHKATSRSAKSVTLHSFSPSGKKPGSVVPVGYPLKDDEVVVPLDKMTQLETYLATTFRILKLLSTEMQTIKSTLSSLSEEVKKPAQHTSVDYLSLLSNLASVLSLLLAIGLAIQKTRAKIKITI